MEFSPLSQFIENVGLFDTVIPLNQHDRVLLGASENVLGVYDKEASLKMRRVRSLHDTNMLCL